MCPHGYPPPTLIALVFSLSLLALCSISEVAFDGVVPHVGAQLILDWLVSGLFQGDISAARGRCTIDTCLAACWGPACRIPTCDVLLGLEK